MTKSSIPKFMKHSGSIQGPPDLSSRRGFSRVAVEKFVEEKAEVTPLKKSRLGQAPRVGQ
jgi:hypothetical protein